MTQTSKNVREKTKRNFRSKEQWRQLIDDYENSELSTAAFCAQQGIAPSGFYNWRKTFRDETQTRVEPALIELPQTLAVTPIDPHQWDIELELGSGRVLRIRGV